MDPETHAVIRTAAAAIAALALVAAAWSAHRTAEYEQEQACFAAISANAASSQAVYPGGGGTGAALLGMARKCGALR